MNSTTQEASTVVGKFTEDVVNKLNHGKNQRVCRALFVWSSVAG